MINMYYILWQFQLVQRKYLYTSLDAFRHMSKKELLFAVIKGKISISKRNASYCGHQ